MVKFISYDGRWPNLCSGKLVLEIDGKEIVFPRHTLSSGGGVSWRGESDQIWHGEWSINEYNWPEELPVELMAEVLEVINDNVPHGCCGGCI